MSEKYFRIFTDHPSIPSISRVSRPSYLYMGEKIENPQDKILKYKIGGYQIGKPLMGDYLPSPRTIFSDKVYNVLSPLNIKTIQFIPAEIEISESNVYKNYWGLSILKRIKCLDVEKSKLHISDSGISNIKKVVLDQEVLKEIPLEERLIFQLEEHIYDLFHESIVDEIKLAEPEGIQFLNFEDFDDNYHYNRW